MQGRILASSYKPPCLIDILTNPFAVLSTCLEWAVWPIVADYSTAFDMIDWINSEDVCSVVQIDSIPFDHCVIKNTF